MANTTITVTPYVQDETSYSPYNSNSYRVAKAVAESIVAKNSNLEVDHIGSTAVPGCWGTGVMDLLVQYNPGSLAQAYNALENLGFQRQTGAEAFAESRPMYAGNVEYLGRGYGVHLQVIEKGDAEVGNLLKFRDLLRGNPGLRRAYEAEKRRILSRGIAKGNEYVEAKAEFIRAALAAAEL